MDIASNHQAPGKSPDGETVAAEPKSVGIASRGIRTDRDAAEYLSALIGDVMTQTVPTRVASTGVNAMGKLLKVVEMRHKYGNPEDQSRTLQLLDDRQTAEEKRLREEEDQTLARAAEIHARRHPLPQPARAEVVETTRVVPG